MKKLHWSIQEIHDAFDRGEFTPTELVQEYLGRIRASSHNAFIEVCEARALEQAARWDKELKAKGKVPKKQWPLFGIPIGVKDNMAVDGVRTTCASKMLENYVSPYTATAVERLEEAGAITLGKLNLDEFAMGSSNENSYFGPVKHPTHPDRVPGGSSGGSATAVQAGLCVASLGSDTGGSIRLPASFCGVVGIKPTYGRISRYGLVAFASSLDQIGPFSMKVEDSVKLLDVMSGQDPKDATTAPMLKGQWSEQIQKPLDWKKIRVGVPKEYQGEQGEIDAEVKESMQRSLQWMKSQGATLVDVSLPHTQYALSTYYIVAVSEASSNLARFDGVRFGTRQGAQSDIDLQSFYKKIRSGFGAEVKRRIILGTFALSSGYYDAFYGKACRVRRLIKQDFDQVFSKVDVLVSPVSPVTAFKAGERTADPIKMYLVDVFTIPANMAGIPAMSMPCGKDSQGLSIGLHLMGPQFGEEKMLSIAHAFERDFVRKEMHA